MRVIILPGGSVNTDFERAHYCQLFSVEQKWLADVRSPEKLLQFLKTISIRVATDYKVRRESGTL